MNSRNAVLVRRYKISVFYQLVTAAKAKILRETLRDHDGNRSRAARALGLQRTCLLRLIRELGIETAR
jgi:DNA-binding NtrC family response regulator